MPKTDATPDTTTPVRPTLDDLSDRLVRNANDATENARRAARRYMLSGGRITTLALADLHDAALTLRAAADAAEAIIRAHNSALNAQKI